MICACIDIGSNTTRLLVAEVAEGALRELAARRAFTRIGRSVGADGEIPADKIAETAAVVSDQVALAREQGAGHVVGVATAAIRGAPNRDELVDAVSARCGLELSVLGDEEEARLSFVGATRTLPRPAEGTIAVIDVGGGSTEIAVGDSSGPVDWWSSFRIGSGLLADAHLRSDPPAADELDRVRAHVAAALEGFDPPAAGSAVAVGGTATSLRRLAGGELSHETLEHCVHVLATTPVDEVARRHELEAERVRLLPSGILVLAACSQALGLPLQIARGGLREGLLLELVEGRQLA